MEHDTKLAMEWFENDYLKLNENKYSFFDANYNLRSQMDLMRTSTTTSNFGINSLKYLAMIV